MTTKDEVRSTVEALKLALTLALEALEETRNALAWFYDSYPQDVTQKGNDLLPHVETVLTAIRQALANKSKALADSALERIAENERELGLDYMDPAEIPQSIICPFCESQHVPGWLHDYNMDRMKKPAPPHECKTDAEKTAFAFGWWKALEENRKQSAQPSQRSVKPWVHATTWRGLTDEAVWSLYKNLWMFHPAEEPRLAGDILKFARAIEAKLKEKNGF